MQNCCWVHAKQTLSNEKHSENNMVDSMHIYKIRSMHDAIFFALLRLMWYITHRCLVTISTSRSVERCTCMKVSFSVYA